MGRVAHGPTGASTSRSGSPLHNEEVGTTSEPASRLSCIVANRPEGRLRQPSGDGRRVRSWHPVSRATDPDKDRSPARRRRKRRRIAESTGQVLGGLPGQPLPVFSGRLVLKGSSVSSGTFHQGRPTAPRVATSTLHARRPWSMTATPSAGRCPSHPSAWPSGSRRRSARMFSSQLVARLEATPCRCRHARSRPSRRGTRPDPPWPRSPRRFTSIVTVPRLADSASARAGPGSYRAARPAPSCPASRCSDRSSISRRLHLLRQVVRAHHVGHRRPAPPPPWRTAGEHRRPAASCRFRWAGPTRPRTIWSAWRGSMPRFIEISTVSSNLAFALPFTTCDRLRPARARLVASLERFA